MKAVTSNLQGRYEVSKFYFYGRYSQSNMVFVYKFIIFLELFFNLKVCYRMHMQL